MNSTLSYAAITERRVALDRFHARLLTLLKRLHPRAARSPVLGIVQSALYGLPLLFPNSSQTPLRPAETAWAALVKRASQITQFAAHADSMIEMGCPTIETQLSKQVVNWHHRRHCFDADKASVHHGGGGECSNLDMLACIHTVLRTLRI